MSDLEKFLAEASESVDERLNLLVPNAETEPKKLHEAIRWSLFAGGKRFRPALIFAAGKIFGADERKLLSAAASIEMIHTYSLIHDDLPAMDDDDLRRGKATCHIKFGAATAILAGDVLQTLAFQALAEDENLSAEIRIKLISEIARAAGTPVGMVAGQQLDLEAEGKIVSIAELENIHRNKTGAIISVSARSGAMIAEAAESELAAITKYSENLGLLFQITDDLIDATQTTETLGKTAGKDERASKATYVSLYGLEKAQELAQETRNAACAELDKIGRDTGLLKDLLDFILRRRF